MEEYVRRGFLPSGPDATNELGLSVGEKEDGTIVIIHPGHPNHGEQVPNHHHIYIQWNHEEETL